MSYKMTSSEITPKVCWEFENQCGVYFLNVKEPIADDRKVANILGCFEQDHVMEWTSTKWEHLIKMTFEEFMKEFHAHWLPMKWEQMVLTLILGTNLDPEKTNFIDWSVRILSHNIWLQGYPAHMNEKDLRRQLEVMLDEELRTLASNSEISEIMDLSSWMAKIKEIDKRQQAKLKHMAHFFDTSTTHHAKCQNIGQNQNSCSSYCRSSYRWGNNTSALNQNNNPKDNPPKLTDDECCLMCEHEGCFKCQEFYVTHHAAACQVKLSGKDYKPCTLQDVLWEGSMVARQFFHVASTLMLSKAAWCWGS